MSALVIDAVVRDGEIHVTDPAYRMKREKAAKSWGDGVALKIRIEPEDEAWFYSDVKHYYGHLITPVATFTGETKHDVHLRMKVLFMPDGKTSITELNREEFKGYLESVEQCMREETPEAWDRAVDLMSLYEQRRAS